jgi:hypothetical protein
VRVALALLGGSLGDARALRGHLALARRRVRRSLLRRSSSGSLRVRRGGRLGRLARRRLLRVALGLLLRSHLGSLGVTLRLLRRGNLGSLSRGGVARGLLRRRSGGGLLLLLAAAEPHGACGLRAGREEEGQRGLLRRTARMLARARPQRIIPAAGALCMQQVAAYVFAS